MTKIPKDIFYVDEDMVCKHGGRINISINDTALGILRNLKSTLGLRNYSYVIIVMYNSLLRVAEENNKLKKRLAKYERVDEIRV